MLGLFRRYRSGVMPIFRHAAYTSRTGRRWFFPIAARSASLMVLTSLPVWLTCDCQPVSMSAERICIIRPQWVEITPAGRRP